MRDAVQYLDELAAQLKEMTALYEERARALDLHVGVADSSGDPRALAPIRSVSSEG